MIREAAARRSSNHLRLQRDADVRVEEYKQIGAQGHFTLARQDKELLHVTLNAPGRHNALNAAAAVAVATEEGIDDEGDPARAGKLPGDGASLRLPRRVPLEAVNGKPVPRCWWTTTVTIRRKWTRPSKPHARAGRKDLVMIFQPHRFTRTRDLYDDFASVLSQVDTRC